MGSLFNKYKLWILLGGVIIAAGIWFGMSSSAPSNSVITTTSVNDGGSADQDLVNTLLQLRAVSLNGAIFTNVAFMGLQDFSTHIVQEPVGRGDPFAPLDGTSQPGDMNAAAIHAAQMYSNASTTASTTPPSTLPRAPRR